MDLLEYSRHEGESLAILRNAHEHVARFLDPAVEDFVALMVLIKYFEASGQLEPRAAC
jgi:hypothetical protein